MDLSSPWIKDNGPITLSVEFYDRKTKEKLVFPVEGQSLAIEYSAHGDTKHVFYTSQEAIRAFQKDVVSKAGLVGTIVGFLGIVMPVASKAGFDGLAECLFCKKGERMLGAGEIALPLTSRWRIGKDNTYPFCNHPFLTGLALYQAGWVENDSQVLYVYLEDRESFWKLDGFWDAGYLKWHEGVCIVTCQDIEERRKLFIDDTFVNHSR